MIESVYDRVGVTSGWSIRESGAKRVRIRRGHALRAKASLRFEILKQGPDSLKLPHSAHGTRAYCVAARAVTARAVVAAASCFPGLCSSAACILKYVPVYE